MFHRYNYASPSHLIGRLTSRNMHLLALRISNFLGLKPDAVLKHWACAKIMKSRAAAGADASGDDEVCKAIVEKFDEYEKEMLNKLDKLINVIPVEDGRDGILKKEVFTCFLAKLHKRTR